MAGPGPPWPEAEQGLVSPTKNIGWKQLVGGVGAFILGHRLEATKPGGTFVGKKLIAAGIGNATTITAPLMMFGDGDPTNPLTYVFNPSGNGEGLTRENVVKTFNEFGFFRQFDEGPAVPTNWVPLNDFPNGTAGVSGGGGPINESPPSSLGADP